MVDISGSIPEGRGACILEGCPQIRSQCMVARCLVEPRGGRVPVRLLNPTADEIKVAASTPVASVESVGNIPADSVAGVSLSSSTDPKLDQGKFDMLRALVDNCDAKYLKSRGASFMICWCNTLTYLLTLTPILAAQVDSTRRLAQVVLHQSVRTCAGFLHPEER